MALDDFFLFQWALDQSPTSQVQATVTLNPVALAKFSLARQVMFRHRFTYLKKCVAEYRRHLAKLLCGWLRGTRQLPYNSRKIRYDVG